MSIVNLCKNIDVFSSVVILSHQTSVIFLSGSCEFRNGIEMRKNNRKGTYVFLGKSIPLGICTVLTLRPSIN